MVKDQVYIHMIEGDHRSAATDRLPIRQSTPGHQLPNRPLIRKLSRHLSLGNQVRDSWYFLSLFMYILLQSHHLSKTHVPSGNVIHVTIRPPRSSRSCGNNNRIDRNHKLNSVSGILRFLKLLSICIYLNRSHPISPLLIVTIVQNKTAQSSLTVLLKFLRTIDYYRK